MRAAARLGLDWKKSSSSRRLFVSSLATAAEEADVGKKKSMILESEKSLYLCFVENNNGRFRSRSDHVVRRIRLNSYDEEEEEYLRDAAYKRCNRVWNWSSPCRFGSQILFPEPGIGNGNSYTHMSWIDTSTFPSRKKFKFSTKFKPFSTPKTNPVLIELNRKLYCIDKSNPFHRFEVLDNDEDEGGFKWRPLAEPPLSRERGATFASGTNNKILAWDRHMTGVCCYDVTKPENGWTTQSYSSSFSLGKLPPLLGYYRRPPTFIQNYHPDLGDFYLMFTCDLYNEPLIIYPFFMSTNFDYFQQIGKIQLPKELLMCSKYPYYTDYELVDLGAQKLCLVLSKSFCDDTAKVKKGILLLITFEYDTVKTSTDIQIRTRFLGTRHFRYPSRLLAGQSHCTDTFPVYLTGAFVL